MGQRRHACTGRCELASTTSGLRHLHLRLHRHAKGRGQHPCRHRQPIGVGTACFAAATRAARAAKNSGRFRRLGVGTVLAAARGRMPGAGTTRRPQGSDLSACTDRTGHHRYRAFRAVDAAGVPRRLAARRMRQPAAHRLQRRSLARRSSTPDPSASAARAAVQPLRPNRSGGGSQRMGMHCGRHPQRADWPPHRQHTTACTRCAAAAGADRRHRRIADRRHTIGPWLPGPPRPDRRTFRPRSVRRAPRRTHVPHRRSGALACRWRHRISRPQRWTAQATRRAYRTGRNRKRAAWLLRCARGSRHRPQRSAWGYATGRLRGRRCRCTRPRCPARPPRHASARHHAPQRLRAPGRAAADRQWQTGSTRATSARGRCARDPALRRPARRTRNPARRAVE